MHVPGYTARSQQNYDKFPQRRCVWQEKSSEKKLSGRTSLHYDEANDLTFCHIYMVAYKDGKLNSNNLDASVAFKNYDFSKCHRHRQ